jgi:hypothetical protein
MGGVRGSTPETVGVIPHWRHGNDDVVWRDSRLRCQE